MRNMFLKCSFSKTTYTNRILHNYFLSEEDSYHTHLSILNREMASSSISSLMFASKQVTIYLDIPIFIIGLIGNILNVLVFLSLRTFRENSCAFYLTVMSIANIVQLLTGVLNRIMVSGFSIDAVASSMFYCKFNGYCIQLCVLTSFTCMCLAAIDQFLVTCSNVRWQQWSNIKVAHRLTVAFIFIWILHGISYAIYTNLAMNSVTGQLVCIFTNGIMSQYNTYAFYIILTGFIPLSVTIIFGSLAYHNVQQLAHRSVPLVRREVEKQLSVMVFAHIIYNVIATVPFLTISLIMLNRELLSDPLISAQFSFAINVALCLYFLNFSVS